MQNLTLFDSRSHSLNLILYFSLSDLENLYQIFRFRNYKSKQIYGRTELYNTAPKFYYRNWNVDPTQIKGNNRSKFEMLFLIFK